MREISEICMFFFVFALFAFPVSVSAQATATATIGDVCVTPDSSVTMPIMVNNVANLGSGTINIAYNPSVVHVTGVVSGTENALAVQSWNTDNNMGVVQIVAWDVNTPHSGDVVFANITYKAIGGEGSATTLNIVVEDLTHYYNYTLIPHTTINGTFTVTPSAEPTPTPTQTPSNGGGSGGGGGGSYVPATPTPTPAPTEKPLTVEKALQTISNIEAGKMESATFVGLDMCKISIGVDKNVSCIHVMVEKVDKPEEITETPAPGIVYSYYNITATNLTDVNVTATIEFKVNKSWIANENVDEATITLDRYEREEGWKTSPASKINDDNSSLYFSAETPGFSLFAISGTKKVEVATTPSPTLALIITPSPATPAQTPASRIPILPAKVEQQRQIMIIGLVAFSIILMILIIYYYVRFKSKHG